MTIQDCVAGTLIGLAAGDRIGGPSRMALTLAESLLARQRFDLEHIGQSYLTWWQTEGFDTGPTAAQVFSLVERGLPFSEAAQQVHAKQQGLTAGCNPAHRAAPLAMFATLPDSQLPHAARKEAALTHHHPLAGDVSAQMLILCRSLIHKTEFDTTLKTLHIDILPKEQLQRGGFAPHVLSAAVHFVHTHTDFDTMLTAAINFAGPANYCPVLAGAIGGARWGASAVATHWFSDPLFLEQVQESAQALARGWSANG